MTDSAVKIIQDQIAEAIRALKCHRCGCLHKTVEALASTEQGRNELAPILNEAKSVFVSKEYDCLGCPVCYPAIAANAFSEVHPEVADGLDLCPTDAPDGRVGWPPLPGDYQVVRYQAPVAVCTLNSSKMAEDLRDNPPAGLSIIGMMHTENLGIERVIRNVNANPNIRFLERVVRVPPEPPVSLYGLGKRHALAQKLLCRQACSRELGSAWTASSVSSAAYAGVADTEIRNCLVHRA